jgi:hypothetical protein
MIEAMACGTPVIGFPCGSVPEVIEHGVTGFIVADDDEAIRAVRHLRHLDPRGIRATFEQRFTCRQMAKAYILHYLSVISSALSAADKISIRASETNFPPPGSNAITTDNRAPLPIVAPESD